MAEAMRDIAFRSKVGRVRVMRYSVPEQCEDGVDNRRRNHVGIAMSFNGEMKFVP